MSQRAASIQHLRHALVGVDTVTEGWVGLDVIDDGAEAIIVFRWQSDDPNVYALRIDLDEDHAWWHYEPCGVLAEELLTGLTSRSDHRPIDGRIELGRRVPN